MAPAAQRQAQLLDDEIGEADENAAGHAGRTGCGVPEAAQNGMAINTTTRQVQGAARRPCNLVNSSRNRRAAGGDAIAGNPRCP